MDTLEVKEYEGEEGFDECVECGCREVSVLLTVTVVRVPLCKCCVKELSNTLLKQVEVK